MTDLTLLSLAFDESIGPVIQSIDGPIVFSDLDQTSIRASSFPESARHLDRFPHVYSFIVASYYCHCVYLQKPDPENPRGFRLFSLVLVTTQGFLEPVFDLLKSVRLISSQNSEDIVDLVKSMWRIWSTVLRAGGKSCELPLFTGLRSYSFPLKSLPSDKVMKYVKRHCDLLGVWESAVFDEPIIVLASTPSVASRAVRALTSLLGPQISPRSLPYIAVADPRFDALIQNPIGIIGVSNPIVTSLLSPGVRIVTIGVSGKERHKSAVGDSGLVTNSENLILGIRAAFCQPARRSASTPDLALIKQSLVSKGVRTSMGMDQFVSKLVTVPLFESLREQRYDAPI
jgi:hypothetical protein